MTGPPVRTTAFIGLLLAAIFSISCSGNPDPVARPTPPQPAPGTTASIPSPPAPPAPVEEPTIVPAEPVPGDDISSASLDDLNRSSPLGPVFFDYDSSEISTDAQAILDRNAAVLRTYPDWKITIEGHCDERGSAEYNLALGDRRAVSARAYLVSLGIPTDRVRTVSYGKEFPFDPGHDEAAWANNRRAHFVITGK